MAYFTVAIQRGNNFDQIPKDKTSDASRIRQHYQDQLREIQTIYASVERDNCRIYYEAVPQYAQLEIPSAQHIFQPLSWSPPSPIPITIKIQESSGCMVM